MTNSLIRSGILAAALLVSPATYLPLQARAAYQDADPAKKKAFEKKMTKTVKELRKDPNYKRIPVKSSADRDWFAKQAYALWDKKITKDEFVTEGAKKFPDNKSSFEAMADKLQTP